jgi:hypothetical protein
MICESCWLTSPSDRPNAKSVLIELEAIQRSNQAEDEEDDEPSHEALLSHCAQTGNANVLRRLLKQDSHGIYARNGNVETLLTIANRHGQKEIKELLVSLMFQSNQSEKEKAVRVRGSSAKEIGSKKLYR